MAARIGDLRARFTMYREVQKLLTRKGFACGGAQFAVEPLHAMSGARMGEEGRW